MRPWSGLGLAAGLLFPPNHAIVGAFGDGFWQWLKMRRDSFQRCYYEKVALGEGCGCAEHVTRIRDLDALGESMASGRSKPGALSIAAGWVRNLARRIARHNGVRPQG